MLRASTRIVCNPSASCAASPGSLPWTLTAIVEEVLAVVREKETEHPGRKTRVD